MIKPDTSPKAKDQRKKRMGGLKKAGEKLKGP
jgi:hypothetical protein